MYRLSDLDINMGLNVIVLFKIGSLHVFNCGNIKQKIDVKTDCIMNEFVQAGLK